MDHHLIRVVQALCEDVATPRALAVHLLVRHGEWTQLCELRVRPDHYGDSESYFRDALVTDLLRKVKFPGQADTRAAALKTFFSCEKQNFITNKRLARYLPSYPLYVDEQECRVLDFISRWRKEVKRVLGHLPDSLTPRFSGGATYGDTGVYITTPDKMSSAPQITQSARDVCIPFWGQTLWAGALLAERPWLSDPVTVRGNSFFTVPKDNEKDRGCCKEPSLNISFQLDVGRIMKARLLRGTGIDLKHGQSVHRDAARRASVSGDFATIDMSNASDTLAKVLVKLVLPKDWFSLLDSLRSPLTEVDGRWHLLEKFSSMGNGFTFELETLLFSTLARVITACEGGDSSQVLCYGDDLIVHRDHVKSVLAALRFFGFSPNKDKTFVEGPFRESCGGDFFSGVPVRAHFLKELPDEPHKWISLANGLRRVAGRDKQDSSGLRDRWSLVLRAWQRCLDPLPRDLQRLRGPSLLGDVVIHDTEEHWSRATFRWKRKRSGDITVVEPGLTDGIRAWVPVATRLEWRHWTPSVQLACATLGLPSAGVTPRGGVSGYRKSVIPLYGITDTVI